MTSRETPINEPPKSDMKVIKADKVSLISYPYVPKLSGRGIDRYCYFLSRYLAEAGVRVKVTGMSSVKTSLGSVTIAEPRMMWNIYRAKASIFHAVSPVGGRLAAYAHKTPLITTIHDVIPFFLNHYSPLKYRFLRHCISICARSSDSLLVPFEFTKKFLVKKFEVKPEKVTVVNYGVDLDEFYPKCSRDSGNKRVLFLGGAFPVLRGGDNLLRAFQIASSEVNGVQLLLSGTGPEESMLKSLTETLELDRKVRFLGFVKEGELARYLRYADLLVHPSRLGFSLSVLQAMASRTPVLVSDDLDSPECVRDARSVCPSGDIRALSKAIIRILTDDDFAQSVAQKGYERSRDFSLEQMATDTFKAYNRLI